MIDSREKVELACFIRGNQWHEGCKVIAIFRELPVPAAVVELFYGDYTKLLLNTGV